MPWEEHQDLRRDWGAGPWAARPKDGRCSLVARSPERRLSRREHRPFRFRRLATEEGPQVRQESTRHARTRQGEPYRRRRGRTTATWRRYALGRAPGSSTGSGGCPWAASREENTDPSVFADLQQRRDRRSGRKATRHCADAQGEPYRRRRSRTTATWRRYALGRAPGSSTGSGGLSEGASRGGHGTPTLLFRSTSGKEAQPAVSRTTDSRAAGRRGRAETYSYLERRHDRMSL